jgi:flagella basal body P-ring formation protein FlgA
MTRLARLLILLLPAVRFAPGASGCIAIEGERILARDLAQSLPAFSTVPADTQIGYAPVPGVKRFFYTPELQRLAARYHLTLSQDAEVCIERVLEPLRPEAVVEAMKKALGAPEARIEVVELSRFPVPRGEIEFARSALPPAALTPVIWRGIIHYAGGRRFAIWARVKIRVPTTQIIAVEAIPSGRPVAAGQIKLEKCELYPSGKSDPPSLDQVIGRIPRNPIAAGAAVTPDLLDAPKEVESGDLVQVEVRSGAARLSLEGRAQSAGSHGQAISIRNLATGKSFSARVVDKDRVLLNAALPGTAKDTSK